MRMTHLEKTPLFQYLRIITTKADIAITRLQSQRYSVYAKNIHNKKQKKRIQRNERIERKRRHTETEITQTQKYKHKELELRHGTIKSSKSRSDI